jgi:hypothetical protein
VLSYGRRPETDAEFYREFLRSDIITLGKPAQGAKVKEGLQLLEKDTKVNLRLLEYRGEPVVAVYSSMKRLTEVIPEEYYRETGYLQMNCRTLLEMVKSMGRNDKLALNPGHMVVKTLSHDEVHALLDGTIFKQLEEARVEMNAPRSVTYPKGSVYYVGRPKVTPTRLMDNLANYLQSTGDVEQAFLGQILRASGEPPHLVICIKLLENSKRTFTEVSADLGPTIKSVLGEQEILEILDLKSESGLPISKLVRFFPR